MCSQTCVTAAYQKNINRDNPNIIMSDILISVNSSFMSEKFPRYYILNRFTANISDFIIIISNTLRY